MEKFDKKIAKEIAKALGDERRIMHNRFTFAMREIRNAKSIDDVMGAKQELMAATVLRLPTQDGTCYFCKYHNSFCDECSYGKVHGICRRNGSVWKTLTGLKYDLLSYINKNYWTGGELENAEHQRYQDRQVEDTSMGKA